MASRLIAAVERKSLADLTSSILNGTLKYQLTDLAVLPRAAVVVEDRYSRLFALEHARPTIVLDGLAELHIAFANVPITFCETRKLAQEFTYRYLAAAHTWSADSADLSGALGVDPMLAAAPDQPEPSTAEVRAWARQAGLPVPDRGRLQPTVWQAWREAHRGE
jgi:hypothetical protein